MVLEKYGEITVRECCVQDTSLLESRGSNHLLYLQQAADMPAPSEMGGAGTTGHAPIPEEEEDDEEVDEAGVEAKVQFTLVRLSFKPELRIRFRMDPH